MKHELIILQGIQGSGKTTWAKNWVKELILQCKHSEPFVRFR